MKYFIVAAFCLVVCVMELSAAPVKKDHKKDDHKSKKQSIPGAVTTYGSPQYPQQSYTDTTYTAGTPCADPSACGYADPYNTGYNAMGYPQASQAPEDVFNKPVELVGVKNLNIKDGKVNPPTEIIQG